MVGDLCCRLKEIFQTNTNKGSVDSSRLEPKNKWRIDRKVAAATRPITHCVDSGWAGPGVAGSTFSIDRTSSTIRPAVTHIHHPATFRLSL